jgi:hypothetical protein
MKMISMGADRAMTMVSHAGICDVMFERRANPPPRSDKTITYRAATGGRLFNVDLTGINVFLVSGYGILSRTMQAGKFASSDGGIRDEKQRVRGQFLDIASVPEPSSAGLFVAAKSLIIGRLLWCGTQARLPSRSN